MDRTIFRASVIRNRPSVKRLSNIRQHHAKGGGTILGIILSLILTLSHVDLTETYATKTHTTHVTSLVEPITVVATAYTLRPQETGGKTADHPAYGVTASGERAERGVTIAASREIPFGTRVYIPYFDGRDGWENGGVFTVTDRGGAIKHGRIDVFFGEGEQALREALEFGKQTLEIYIIEEGME